MKRHLRLYLKFIAQYLKSLMEYKGDFILGLIGFFITQGAGILFIFLVFQKIPDINGWSFYQIMLIYGFAQIPRGIDHLLADNLWILAWRIVIKGDFDRYLLRPVNPLFQLLSERFQPEAFGELFVGGILVTISIMNLGISFSLFDVFIFVVVAVFGAMIYTGIKLLIASIAFWTKTSNAMLFMCYSLSDFTKYPLTAYSVPVRAVLTFVIPFAFTAYFPAAYFVGKENIVTAVAGTVVAAVITMTAAYYTWLMGIKAYESAGS